jgi:hypothetical protein
MVRIHFVQVVLKIAFFKDTVVMVRALPIHPLGREEFHCDAVMTP